MESDGRRLEMISFQTQLLLLHYLLPTNNTVFATALDPADLEELPAIHTADSCLLSRHFLLYSSV